MKSIIINIFLPLCAPGAAGVLKVPCEAPAEGAAFGAGAPE